MKENIEEKKISLENGIKAIKKIIEGLKVEDIKKKLQVMNEIEQLQDFSRDEEIKQMKEYREYRNIQKKLYVETARTIMNILDTVKTFSGDPKTSFNYTEPVELMLAADFIKTLPNAFIGGPMKSAINNPSIKVKTIALDYYDSLPREVKYSDVFPPNFTKMMAQLRAQLKG